jgi:hypothetical protein
LTTEGIDVNQRKVIREALSRGGETVTVPTRKIPTTAIEQVRKAMQNAPECLAKEVSKVQAIQALTPDIRQMQSKGYEWTAIANLLSEHGIAVTPVTLKSYLQQAKAGRGKRAHRRSESPRSGSIGARNRADQRTADTARGADPGASKVSLAPRPVPIAKHSPGEILTTNPPAQGAGTRRSAFVPEEDTDDI